MEKNNLRAPRFRQLLVLVLGDVVACAVDPAVAVVAADHALVLVVRAIHNQAHRAEAAGAEQPEEK